MKLDSCLCDLTTLIACPVKFACRRHPRSIGASQGGRSPSYTEEQGAAVMAREEIGIRIELGRGDCSETIWTTDLSHEYVRINAEYRT